MTRSTIPLACWVFAIWAFSTSLAAQGTTFIAYPQDTTTGTSLNSAFFGEGGSGAGHEARVQMLIPRAFLPSTGGSIVAIEVVPGVTRSLTYESLQLSLDHLSSPVPFPALQATFAANLSAPSTVWSIANTTITYPGLLWYRLTFQQPFAYNGRDHLLLDFTKYVPPQGMNNGQGMVSTRDERVDIPWALVSSNIYGSGAASRATGVSTASLRMRVVFAGDVPTTVISSPLVGTTYYGIGTNIRLDTQAAPSALVWQALELAIPPLPGLGGRATPLRLSGIAGDGWLLPGPGLLIFPGVMPPSGVRSTTVPLPFLPALQGLPLLFQSIVFDTSGLAWSSATDCTIG